MPADGDDKVVEKNPLELSDEDFLNSAQPVGEPIPEPAVVPEPVVEATPKPEPEGLLPEVAAAKAAEEEAAAKAAAEDAGKTEDKPAEAGKEGGEGEDTNTKPAAADGADTPGSGDGEDKLDADGKKIEAKAADDTPPDYAGFYAQVMTPFKANGKTITLKSAQEALQLMQMGANYTRKMQEIAPHRKTLTMLQNNNIDEERLSFLIDLDKKDPEAIKKLIKDSGIDPLEIDTTAESAYREGSHRVTDEEVNFRTSLDELSSTPEGKETLQIINSKWDQASKDLLWKHPETMALIHAQRDAGVYDRIVEEMDRRTVLGLLPQGTAFLEGYKIVGDELTAADAFADLRAKPTDTAEEAKPEPVEKPEPSAAAEPLATRAATPKPTLANDDAASAASATRAAPRKAAEFVNPLAMSDDEFLKQLDGRL